MLSISDGKEYASDLDIEYLDELATLQWYFDDLEDYIEVGDGDDHAEAAGSLTSNEPFTPGQLQMDTPYDDAALDAIDVVSTEAWDSTALDAVDAIEADMWPSPPAATSQHPQALLKADEAAVEAFSGFKAWATENSSPVIVLRKLQGPLDDLLQEAVDRLESSARKRLKQLNVLPVAPAAGAPGAAAPGQPTSPSAIPTVPAAASNASSPRPTSPTPASPTIPPAATNTTPPAGANPTTPATNATTPSPAIPVPAANGSTAPSPVNTGSTAPSPTPSSPAAPTVNTGSTAPSPTPPSPAAPNPTNKNNSTPPAPPVSPQPTPLQQQIEQQQRLWEQQQKEQAAKNATASASNLTAAVPPPSPSPPPADTVTVWLAIPGISADLYWSKYHQTTLDTVALLSGTSAGEWHTTAYTKPSTLGRHRHLLQQLQQQLVTQVTLNLFTTNQAVVVFKLSHAPLDSTAASSTGCTQELCIRLAAAGVPIAPGSVFIGPPTDSNLTFGPAQPMTYDQQLAANRRLGAIIGGSVAGGFLLLHMQMLKAELPGTAHCQIKWKDTALGPAPHPGGR
eukprot:gene10790-10947_t